MPLSATITTVIVSELKRKRIIRFFIMTHKVVVHFALTEFRDVKYSKQTEIAFSSVLFPLINKFVYGELEYQRTEASTYIGPWDPSPRNILNRSF